MATIHGESSTYWFKSDPGNRDYSPPFLERRVEPEEEKNGIWIGQWYYYLHLHDNQIDLCRNQGSLALPSIPEVMKHGVLAVSDDDLESAVQYQSGGTFEPGYYHISPLIERKLRILFE